VGLSSYSFAMEIYDSDGEGDRKAATPPLVEKKADKEPEIQAVSAATPQEALCFPVQFNESVRVWLSRFYPKGVCDEGSSVGPVSRKNPYMQIHIHLMSVSRTVQRTTTPHLWSIKYDICYAGDSPPASSKVDLTQLTFDGRRKDTQSLKKKVNRLLDFYREGDGIVMEVLCGIHSAEWGGPQRHWLFTFNLTKTDPQSLLGDLILNYIKCIHLKETKSYIETRNDGRHIMERTQEEQDLIDSQRDETF